MRLTLTPRHKGSILNFTWLPLAKVFWNFIAFILLLLPFSFLKNEPTEPNTDLYFSKKDSIAKCQSPTFNLSYEDVKSKASNDAKIIIYDIRNGTKYAYSDIGIDKLSYQNAQNIDPKNLKIEINGLANPKESTDYFIRVYQSENCFTDHTITLEHTNFSEFIETTTGTKTDLEIAQSVDNSSPKLDSIVTFSTVISNKSNNKATDINIAISPTNGLEIIDFKVPTGKYSSITGIWTVGKLEAGEIENFIIKAKVKNEGLSYISSQIIAVNEEDPDSKAGNNDPTEDDYGLSCVSVPIHLKDNDSYKITLKGYLGVKWFRKVNDELEEITPATSASIAVINSDTSLTIKTAGEYSFSRLRGNCTIYSCCPVKIEGCQVPSIAIDSVFCQPNGSTYTVMARVQTADEVAINQQLQQVLEAISLISGIKSPVKKPRNIISANTAQTDTHVALVASAGDVKYEGNGMFMISNIPLAKVTITLSAKGLRDICAAERTVDAPNCKKPTVPEPYIYATNTPSLHTQTFYHCIDTPFEKLGAKNDKGNTIAWFSTEKLPKLLNMGEHFTPSKAGIYYVIAIDSVNQAFSQKVIFTIKDVSPPEPPVVRSLISCQNKMMLTANGCDGTVQWLKGDSLVATGESYVINNLQKVGLYKTVCVNEFGCESMPRSLKNLNIELGSQPMVSAFCEGTSGKVTILPYNYDFEYSLTGGVSFQADNIFRSVKNGNYKAVMRVKGQKTCQSDQLEIVVHCDCTNICVPFEIKKVSKR